MLSIMVNRAFGISTTCASEARSVPGTNQQQTPLATATIIIATDPPIERQ
jgi:hypothetical protein